LIPRLALTPGEPAGVGPDILIQHAQTPRPYQLIAFADPQLLQQRAACLGLPITVKTIDFSSRPQSGIAGELWAAPLTLAKPVEPGKLDKGNASYVLNCLDKAVDACQQSYCDAMVTGPIQKSIINDAGIVFNGHTEYLAAKTHTPLVVMMLASQALRVALATTHLPLSSVPKAITETLLSAVIRILYRELQKKFGIVHPRILVCGLNPHAGEGGHLGREEIDTIIPTLAKLQQEGIHCMGPLPADTLFTPKYLDKTDAVLAMYHDQGLPVLKYQSFGHAVNVTLGLPIIRTSVDHGTALDLAGTGDADSGSLDFAIETALEMIKRSTTEAKGDCTVRETPRP
jgi:4-hydroxythreonine-4-phosphate dehydrogenase